MRVLKLNPDNFFKNFAAMLFSKKEPRISITTLWVRVKIAKGWTFFISEGDQVFVCDGKLCNCVDKPNAVITALWARTDNTDAQITVQMFGTRELKLIDVVN